MRYSDTKKRFRSYQIHLTVATFKGDNGVEGGVLNRQDCVCCANDPSITLSSHDKYLYKLSLSRPAIRFIDLGLSISSTSQCTPVHVPRLRCCGCSAVLAQDGWWAMWETVHLYGGAVVEVRRLGSNRPRAKWTGTARGRRDNDLQRGWAYHWWT